jgi:hypothetical protein
MQHDLDQTIALLAHTPGALNALLRDLPESWTHRNEGEGTWTPFDIVAHLIDSEYGNWIPRTQMVLEHGESRTFEPLNRGGHTRVSQGKSMTQLLDDFARARAENLDQLRALHLRPEDLERRGRHPTFGRVTLSQLLGTWAAHDLTHLHQLSRVMASQYREIVGPYKAFLGVLKCAGHSDQG